MKTSMFLWGVGVLILFVFGCSKDNSGDPVTSREVLNVSDTVIYLSADAGEKVISLTSDQAWQITGIGDWCSVKPERGEVGTMEVLVKSKFYEEYDDREMELIVKAGLVEQKIKVVQKSKKAIILSPNRQNISAGGGRFSVELKSSVKHEVYIAPEYSWITEIQSRALVTATLTFNVAKNTGGDRKGNIVIKDTESSLADTIVVFQVGIPAFQDRNILIALYEATGGMEWTNHTNWTTDAPTSEWYGITTDREGRVIGIELPDNDLKGALPADLNGLSELQRFVLNGNQLSGKFPEELRLHANWQNWDAFMNIYPQQEGYGFTVEDGEVETYQLATRGQGINLVFMGDGYVQSDVVVGGKYEQDITEAIRLFFAIEPYKSYRDYFNVHVVTAVSNERGITVGSKVKDTKFGTMFVGLVGADMRTNSDDCFAYAKKAPIPNLSSTTIVLVANSGRYGGTTLNWDDGSCIAICPVSTLPAPQDFRAIVQHEAGGHAFAKLDEEYVNNPAAISGLALDNFQKQVRNGFYANVDLTNDLSKVKWAHFIGLEKYADVSAFEGGSCFLYGVWRPENNSCMRDASAYYNAPSREAIVKRIMTLAGETYSFDEFVEKDIIEKPYARSRVYVEQIQPFEPLGRMVLLEGAP
ncbi:M64 family metallopeptidase [Butyricimonas sp. Marseille-P3923]|uniref:M64 family metallopeptidase n=1 Tax=Butyricimonas sp. Marseille-P3923 TaxID=1987504 RepID=UPI00159BC8BF|nr:M64 family metallopeptidase [Butyricimonas sp. Marseille-P3923]